MPREENVTAAHIAAKRHEAALKAWKKRKRAQEGGGGAPVQVRGDFATADGNRFAKAESDLRNADQREAKVLGHGINPSYKVKLVNGKEGTFKPSDYEVPARPGIPPGQMAEREVGAWEVAKLVGMDDMVAPAVIREADVPDTEVPDFARQDRFGAMFGLPPPMKTYQGGHKRGILCGWQVGKVAADIKDRSKAFDGDEDLQRATMFDYVIGNQDRHGGNWVVQRSGKIKLIDHGLSFPNDDGFVGNYMFVKETYNKYKGNELARFAEPYIKNRSKILDSLRKLGLPSKSIEMVGVRIDRISSARFWGDVLGPRKMAQKASF